MSNNDVGLLCLGKLVVKKSALQQCQGGFDLAWSSDSLLKQHHVSASDNDQGP